MNNLEYSTDALEAKALFYGKKTMLFVEGIDDILFWSEFTKSLNLDVHIEEVGGGLELEKIIDRIITEGAKIYVAKDRDYLDFLDESIQSRYHNKRILLTHGHSIENTLYHIVILNDIIKTYVRDPNFDKVQEIRNHFDEFSAALLELLCFEIISFKLKTPIKVLDGSCARYLKNSKSTNLCSAKIDEKITEVATTLSTKELAKIKSKLTKRDITNSIKGHFLTSFVINLIKHYIRKIRGREITINSENLYSSTVSKLSLIQNTPVYKYYMKECLKIN